MELQKDKSYEVTVTKILQRGVIVQIDGMEDTEFIHISKLSTKFVSDISKIVNVGDKYTAIAVYNPEYSRVELSLKHINHAPHRKSHSTVHSMKSEQRKQSLDDMIAAADSVLKEKQRAMNYKPQKSRRRNFDRKES